jgi:hypothetical protein
MKSRYTVLSVGLLIAAILPRAQAIESTPVEFDDHVSDDNSPTYLDLLRLAWPGLQADKDQKDADKDRKDADKDLKDADKDLKDIVVAKCAPHRTFPHSDDASKWEGDSFSDPHLLSAAGPHQVMVTFKYEDVAQATAVLLFEVEPRPRLLDAIGITGMPDNTPLLIQTLSLTGGGKILTFTSAHTNTSLVDEQDTLVSLRDNHLDLIATFGFKQCCEKDDVEHLLNLSGSAGLISISVIEDTKQRRTYTATYKWDPEAKRYRAQSKALDRFTFK